jgi:DNA repair exonuclease SbcCD nuclease subunit
MRILHCSDIHLGRRVVGASGKFSDKRFDDYFTSFDYIVEYALANDIDVFVIAGDLFDKRELSPEVLLRLERILSKLKSHNIPCLVIEGNHDNITSGKESESWIMYLAEKGMLLRPDYSYINDEIQYYPVKIGNVNFYGLGYPGIFADELLGKLSKSIVKFDNETNYVIIHTALSSSDFIHGTVKDKEIIDKLIGKIDYIAAGHFHSYNHYPDENPVFFVPGSPEMWDLNEYKQKKGFIIYNSDTKKIEFIESKNRNKKVFSLKTDAGDLFTAQTYLTDCLINETIENESICYLFIELTNQFELDIAALEEVLYQKGALKVVTRIYGLGGNNNLDLSGFDSTIGEVELEIISGWNKFGKISNETHQLIVNLKHCQIEKLENDFIQTLDVFLDKMIQGEKNDN